MLKQILTPEQSRDARRLAGVSQQTAANAAGVSRTHLALWEVGKYVLSDTALKALRDYYAKTGYVFEEDQDMSEAAQPKLQPKDGGAAGLEGFSLIDGFLVPEGIDSVNVEDALAELAENDAEIDRLAATPVEKELFGGCSQKVSDQIAHLMARNYALVRQLRGHETITPCSKADADSTPDSNGGVLSRVFGKFFGYSDDEPKKKPFGMAKAAATKKPASSLLAQQDW